MAWSGLEWLGVGLEWLGVAWSGSEWLGVAWSGSSETMFDFFIRGLLKKMAWCGV